MPRLVDVLPKAFADGEPPDSPARALCDVGVVATKLTTGSPCSSHQDLFADWPGPQSHVRQWFILENGKAVGIDDDPENGTSFPVIDYVV